MAGISTFWPKNMRYVLFKIEELSRENAVKNFPWWSFTTQLCSVYEGYYRESLPYTNTYVLFLVTVVCPKNQFFEKIITG